MNGDIVAIAGKARGQTQFVSARGASFCGGHLLYLGWDHYCLLLARVVAANYEGAVLKLPDLASAWVDLAQAGLTFCASTSRELAASLLHKAGRSCGATGSGGFSVPAPHPAGDRDPACSGRTSEF